MKVLVALFLVLSFPFTYAMEQNISLDYAWKGTYKLTTVINMPSQNIQKKGLEDKACIRVAVLDDYVNSFAIDLCSSCKEEISSGDKLSFGNDHGTHVASTVKAISPTVKICSYFALGLDTNLEKALFKAANNPRVDVINISLGCAKPEFIEAMVEGGSTFNAIMKALRAGKIIVKAFGNEYLTLPKEVRETYCELLMSLAEREDFQGRFILVTNANYSSNQDILDSQSNRPHRVCKHVITAPGVDITACVDVGKYTSKSGTSMAAPIVAGVIAQLLSDFSDYRSQYQNEELDIEFKNIIVECVLKNTRKVSFIGGAELGVEFGQGIINYKKAYIAIKNILENKNRYGNNVLNNACNSNKKNKRLNSDDVGFQVENKKRLTTEFYEQRKRDEERREQEELELALKESMDMV